MRKLPHCNLDKCACLSLIVFLLLCLHGNAQKNKEQLISGFFYGKTLKFILNDIRRISGMELIYDESDLPAGIVSGRSYKEKPLAYVLEDLLSKTDLQFEIYDEAVVIAKKSEPITYTSPIYSRKKNFDLKGIIQDRESGEALPFANVVVKDHKIGTATNVDGYFTLFGIPDDTCILIVQYMGYKQKLVYLTPKLVSKDIVIDLEKEVALLEEVEIVDEHEELLDISEELGVMTLTTLRMSELPSLGEKDVFRTFQLLPGISASNETSAGLYVRGGTPDQNLVMYDGFTVYHQEHLFGIFSAFNPNAIKDLKLYKGGFEAKYGGRLSSVLDIVGKTGNENEFIMGGEISMLSFNGYTEIPMGDQGSIFLAGRKSYRGLLYDTFFDLMNNNTTQTTTSQPQMPAGGRMGGRTMEQTEPTSYFYDLNAKITYNPTQKDIISLSFFNGQDDLDNSREINRSFAGREVSGGNTDLTKWGNWGTSLKWSRRWNENFYTNNLISYSYYYSSRDKTIQGNRIDSTGATETFKRGTYEDNKLHDFTYKTDNELELNDNNELGFGFQFSNYRIDYIYNQNDTSNILDLHDQSGIAALYFQDRIILFNKLELFPGIRTTYYGMNKKFYFEPRFQLTYALSSGLRLKGAIGRYYQFTNRVIREDIMTGSRDFWMLSDGEDIPVGEAIHYVLGGSYERPDFLIDVEFYYKNLRGLSEYTLRFMPSFHNVDYEEMFYQGTGISRGVDLMVQKKYGKLNGWIGYTFGQVLYNFPVYGEGYFPASHDVTHEFKTVGMYNWKKWTFSAVWIYGTGRPYTEPEGGYVVTLPDGQEAEFVVTGSKNASRYPAYHRLDLSANYKMKLGDMGTGEIGFSLFNVYNRKNLWYKEYEIDESGLIVTDINLMGFTPNVSISFKF